MQYAASLIQNTLSLSSRKPRAVASHRIAPIATRNPSPARLCTVLTSVAFVRVSKPFGSYGLLVNLLGTRRLEDRDARPSWMAS